MQCLRCNKYMHKTIINDVLIDFCEECNTIWLNDNELQEILHNHNPKIEDLIKCINQEKKNDRNTIMYENICPQCGVGKYTKINKCNIEIDECSNCKGLFFDKGELKKVIAKTKLGFWNKLKNYFS